MFSLVQLLNRVIRLLNSETAPSQLAAGVGFGMLIGFSPLMSLHNAILLLLVCLLRVNLSMFFVSFLFFSAMAFGLDFFFDWFGYWILAEIELLRPLWVHLSSLPILPFFRFNNTIVMGSLITGLLLFAPVFSLSVYLVRRYREHWRERIAKHPLVKALQTSKFYGYYQKFTDFRERWGRLT